MKTVLITGGTRGIGRAVLEKFASNGWNTALFYKSSSFLARGLEEKYNALCVQCDISSSSEVNRGIKVVTERFGHIDTLVNNAGISHSGLLQDMSDEEWSRILNTNLSSAFFTSRKVIPSMLANGGNIINISSMWGVTGASCEVAYSASKAGLIGFTKALAKELAPSNIRVNAVAPGVIRTDMLSEYSDSELATLADETPLGRLGESKNIADAVYFLASDEASFITGEVLNVNGGFVI